MNNIELQDRLAKGPTANNQHAALARFGAAAQPAVLADHKRKAPRTPGLNLPHCFPLTKTVTSVRVSSDHEAVRG